MGEIVEPEICPIDRIIFSKTVARRINDVSWGHVNTIEDHKRKFGYILDEAKRNDKRIAIWELDCF